VETLGPAIEESDAEVTCDELPTVLGDAVQMGQLFQNLIANALKFHGEEKPNVTSGAVAENR
jgi:light-regulated signal transduction histidine kinase (bacteriophytochrome)